MESDQSHRRILVADDEPTVAGVVVEEVAQVFRCAVDEVHSGDAALDALAANPYDLFITDMVMPGLQGVDLIARVRLDFPNVDVLVTSGYSGQFPYLDVIRAGAVDFIAKPHPADEMRAKVLRVFRERTLREELEAEKEHVLEQMQVVQETQAAHRVAERKYRTLFENDMSGILIVDAETFTVSDLNQAFCSLVGRDRQAIENTVFFDLFEGPHRDRLEQGMQLLAVRGHGTLGDIMLTRPAGDSVVLDVSTSFVSMGDQRIAQIVCKDMTDQRELQERLVEIAHTCQLTGLLNRSTLYTRISGAIAHAKAVGDPVTLLFIDLDNFKGANDTYGHQTGDELLKVVGALITRQVRIPPDEAFRYGGDEFAILLPGATGEIGARVGDRIRDEYVQGECFGTSMSVGVCQWLDGMNAEEFVKAADQALYDAKAAGKNQIVIAS